MGPIVVTPSKRESPIHLSRHSLNDRIVLVARGPLATSVPRNTFSVDIILESLGARFFHE